MPDPIYISDHVGRAADTTLSQFHGSPKLQGLLEAMSAEVQRLEDLKFSMLTDRLLDAAEGVNLDVIGRIVGFPRLDVSDDDEYRELLGVQIRANNSDCGAEDIIFVASELTGEDVHYWQEGRAHYHLEYVTDTPLTADWLVRVNDMIELVTCSGVSYEMVEGDDPDAFRFDVGPGFDNGKLGNLVGQFS
jgi:hypothetical protein